MALGATVVAATLARQKRQVELQRAEAQRDSAWAAMDRGDLLEARVKLRASLETTDSPLSRALWWEAERHPLHWKHRLPPIHHMDLSVDGKTLAVGCHDGTVYLLDMGARTVRPLSGHSDQIRAVAFAPGGRLLASAALNGTIRLWDHAAGRMVRTLATNVGKPQAMDYSPDGKLLAVTGGPSVRLLDTTTGKTLAQMRDGNTSTWVLRFSPDGELLASAGGGPKVRLWDVAARKLARRLVGHDSAVFGLRFSPDGKLLASGSADKTVRLWPIQGGKPRILREHTGSVQGLAFHPDGRLLFTSASDRTVKTWDVERAVVLQSMASEAGAAVNLEYARDGKLAMANVDQTVRVWRMKRPPPAQPPSSTLGGRAATFSGGKIVSAGIDGTVRVWDRRTGALQASMNRGRQRATWNPILSPSPDGELLASGHAERVIKIWHLPSGTLMRTLISHKSAVWSIAFSPDSKLLATGSGDREIHLWSPRTGARLRQLRMKEETVALGLAFSPDGKLLASAMSNQLVRLWDVASGKQLRTLVGHTGPIYGVAFSPDGKTLASGGLDHTVRLWDLGTGQGRVLRTFASRVHWLSFVQTFNHKLQLWDMKEDRLLASHSAPGVVRVLATNSGCVALTSAGHARIYRANGGPADLAKGVGALAHDGGRLLLATGREVLVLDAGGVRQRAHAVKAGTTALTRVGPWLALGHKRGSLAFVHTGAGPSPPRPTLKELPSSPVTRMLPGPGGTLVIGSAGGQVGIWSLATGKRLHHANLQGTVSHLLLKDRRLHVATDLGHGLVWDLGTYCLEECELLRRIWREVPVAWEGGRAVAAPPPARHRCRK